MGPLYCRQWLYASGNPESIEKPPGELVFGAPLSRLGSDVTLGQGRRRMSRERLQSTGKTSFYGDYLYDRVVPRGDFLRKCPVWGTR